MCIEREIIKYTTYMIGIIKYILYMSDVVRENILISEYVRESILISEYVRESIWNVRGRCGLRPHYTMTSPICQAPRPQKTHKDSKSFRGPSISITNITITNQSFPQPCGKTCGNCGKLQY